MRWLPNMLFSAVALIISTVALWQVHAVRDERSVDAASVIHGIDRLSKVHAATRAKLAAMDFIEPQHGLLPSYLSSIRRDGLSAHKDLKEQLDSLARTNSELSVLIDLYLPSARTAEFMIQAKEFRTYAMTWNDRWNGVMEYFMAGGNYPTSGVAFPAEFPEAVERELAARE